MKMRLAMLLIVGVLYTAQTMQAESPTECEQAEPAQRTQCFEGRGLELAEMPKNLDEVHPLYNILKSTFTMMDPTVHCSNPQEYGEAARCAINVTKSCYDADGMRNIIMNADDVIDGMQVLCNKRQELNMECFKNFYAMVEECTKYHRRASDIPDSSDTLEIICDKDDLKYDCMESLMTPMCGGNTTQIFLEQMDQYTITPACKQNNRPSRPRQRYFQSLQCPKHEDKNGGDGSKGTASRLTTALLCFISFMFVSVIRAVVL